MAGAEGRAVWRGLFGFRLHWGQPPNPTAVHFTTNWSSWPKRWTEHFVEHPVASWFGLSFSHKYYLGLMVFDPQTNERQGTLAERIARRISTSPDDDEDALVMPIRDADRRALAAERGGGPPGQGGDGRGGAGEGEK